MRGVGNNFIYIQAQISVVAALAIAQKDFIATSQYCCILYCPYKIFIFNKNFKKKKNDQYLKKNYIILFRIIVN